MEMLRLGVEGNRQLEGEDDIEEIIKRGGGRDERNKSGDRKENHLVVLQ